MKDVSTDGPVSLHKPDAQAKEMVSFARASGLWPGAWLLKLFLRGALVTEFAFYPLGLARLGERVPVAGLARANAWFLAINCLGSLMGPAMTGAVMDWFGRGALFAAGGGAVALVLVAWGALEASRRWARRPLLAQPADEEARPTRAAA
jgi:hypothetical protein